MAKATITIRIYYSTLKRIRKLYPSKREETMIAYFERVSKELENES